MYSTSAFATLLFYYVFAQRSKHVSSGIAQRSLTEARILEISSWKQLVVVLFALRARTFAYGTENGSDIAGVFIHRSLSFLGFAVDGLRGYRGSANRYFDCLTLLEF